MLCFHLPETQQPTHPPLLPVFPEKTPYSACSGKKEKKGKKKAKVLKSKSLLKKPLSTTLAIINPFLMSAVWKKTISVLLKEAHLRFPLPLI